MALLDLFRRKKETQKEDFAEYVYRCICILESEFHWDQQTVDLAWKYMRDPGDHFEFICDNPMSAMYKLKFHNGYFRLGYYGQDTQRGDRAYELTSWFSNLKY